MFGHNHSKLIPVKSQSLVNVTAKPLNMKCSIDNKLYMLMLKYGLIRMS